MLSFQYWARSLDMYFQDIIREEPFKKQQFFEYNSSLVRALTNQT